MPLVFRDADTPFKSVRFPQYTNGVPETIADADGVKDAHYTLTPLVERRYLRLGVPDVRLEDEAEYGCREVVTASEATFFLNVSGEGRFR